MYRKLLAAAITVLALCAAPALASAQSLNSVSIVSSVTSRFLPLDVSNAATYAGAPVIQWFANAGSNQRWNFVQQPDSNEEIVNQNSGMCLTSDGVAGHWVYQWPCGGYPQQEWKGTLENAWGGSGHGLQNARSGLWLDVDGDASWAGAHIITWYNNDTYGELFTYNQL
jgi:Ricin-type beta-trefoil lectin domain-like